MERYLHINIGKIVPDPLGGGGELRVSLGFLQGSLPLHNPPSSAAGGITGRGIGLSFPARAISGCNNLKSGSQGVTLARLCYHLSH